MLHRNLKLAALAGGAAVLLAAIALLSVGKAGTASARGPALPRRAAAAAGVARPRAAYASTTRSDAAPNPAAAAAAPAGNPALEQARDLLRRLQAAAGPRPELPADLQRDLLAFLEGDEGNRAALFTMAWEPSTPRMVLGHLKLFLMGLPDPEARRALLAAFESFDPHAAANADAAARAKDPSLFVASLRATASPKERVDLMQRIPMTAWSEPHIAAWLLEAARSDQDAKVRGTAYGLLSASGSREIVPLLVDVAGDPGRDMEERKAASFALAINPARPGVDDLLALYADSPEDVRHNLLAALGESPADRRVDDLLVEVVGSGDTSSRCRRAAASALGLRLNRLPAGDARALGARTAEALNALDAEQAVAVLTSLGASVASNGPLKEAVQSLRRTAPAGGAIQVAIVNVPALRFATGMN